jgi:hypothetical protein
MGKGIHLKNIRRRPKKVQTIVLKRMKKDE